MRRGTKVPGAGRRPGASRFPRKLADGACGAHARPPCPTAARRAEQALQPRGVRVGGPHCSQCAVSAVSFTVRCARSVAPLHLRGAEFAKGDARPQVARGPGPRSSQCRRPRRVASGVPTFALRCAVEACLCAESLPLGTSLPSGPPAGKASDLEVSAGGKQETDAGLRARLPEPCWAQGLSLSTPRGGGSARPGGAP